MPKKVIFAKISGLLFLLACTWLVFIVSQTILEAPNNRNGNHIPKDATFVAKIDGKAFLRSGINDVFIESRDNEIIHLFKHFSEQRKKKKSKRKGKRSSNLGIDYVSDIYFFTFVHEKNKILGISVNLSNEHRFNKYLPAHLDEKQGYASSPEVGLILHTITRNNSTDPSRKKLNSLAKRLLEKHGQFDISLLEDDNNRIIAKSWSANGKGRISDFISSSNLSFELKPHELIFDGTVQTLNNETFLKKDLSPSGFHLFVGNVPTSISDTLSSFIKDSLIHLPKIAGLSLNYRGLSIVENDGFFPVPQMDLLIRFEDKVDITEILSTKILKSNIKHLTDHSFHYQESVYNYEQVDDNTIYLGESNLSMTETENNLVFSASGSMQPLTKVDASSMVTAFIKLFPLYSASDNFTQSVKKLDISIFDSNNQKHKEMKGVIEFREKRFVLNSFIKLLIQGEIIK